MNYKKRNQRIKELRKKYSIKQLAKNHNLSYERIRQILNPTNNAKCLIHNRKFPSHSVCSLCYILKYYPKTLNKKSLYTEIKFLKDKNRKIEAVYMRTLLIRYLHDKKKQNFSEIGKLLERDHAAITNLYTKKL